MNRIVTAFFLVTFSLTPFFNPLIHAQTPDDTLSFTSDTLFVEAIRSTVSSADAPLSLSINTRSAGEFAGSAATSIASITQNLPGLWVNDRQNAALGERITIRGIGWRAAFGVRGIQVVLNGIPLTVADGQSVTNIIDPAFIRRIELIRGPAASYWGNSSGGVLYISTRPDYERQKNYYIRTQGGSFQNRKAEVGFAESYGIHDFSSFTSYQYEGGYRNYSSSKILRSSVHGNYQWSSRSRLEYTGALQWMPQAQHPSGLTAKQVDGNPRQANTSFINADAGKQVTQGQLGLTYNYHTPAGLLIFTGYGTYRDLTNPLPFGIITVDRLAGGMRGSLNKQWGDLAVNMGGEIKFQRDDREEFVNNNGSRGAITVNQLEKVSNQALFITSDYSVGPIKFLGSLRYDRITFSTDSAARNQTGERTFQSFSPGFGASYEVGSTLLYSNLSTSFEAPTTTELVNRPDGGNGFNPDLKPEQTTGLEIGARGTIFNNRFEYDFALYRLWIKDLLFPYQLEANGPTFFRNQGETKHQGIELATAVKLDHNISLQTAYTLTDAEFIKAQTIDSFSLRGKSVPGVANHRVSANMSWAPGSFWIQLGGQCVSSYPVNNLNTADNDRYMVFDTKISYEIVFNRSGITMTPFININNLFNERYNGSVVVNAFGGRYYEPAPGRNWQAGISMRF